MIGGDRDSDTICAISTPSGMGGIHLARITGKNSLAIVRRIAPFLPNSVETNRIYFGTIFDFDENQEPLDEVLISYFKEGHSFTGEQTLEISCHGSSFISERILKSLIYNGARLAEKGEFTYRAFINGKLDLVQAEGILSLIESESKKSAQIALKQLKGGLSSDIKRIEQSIVALLARLEIAIDFTSEDVEIISKDEVCLRLDEILKAIDSLLATFRIGQKIQSGYEVLLVGEPNVGKSSLLNRILAEDRAIVTEVPGTTRDIIREDILIKGVKVSLLDSAGVRETNDFVEKIGVSRTKSAIDTSDMVVILFDCANPEIEDLIKHIECDFKKVVLVGNKVDLIDFREKDTILSQLQNSLLLLNKFQCKSEVETFISNRCKLVSTFDENCRDQVLEFIEKHLQLTSFGDESILTNLRHFENLQRSYECLVRGVKLASEKASPEFLALEVKEALIRIQEILGQCFDDQILDRVFSEFCIGK